MTVLVILVVLFLVIDLAMLAIFAAGADPPIS